MLIAITGGIGSGKSVVSQLLRIMGHPVYDCDTRAKWVMTHDPILQEQLIKLFGEKTFESTTDSYILNKPYLSACIFGHPERLAQMNTLVHPAVCRDLISNYQKYASSISCCNNQEIIEHTHIAQTTSFDQCQISFPFFFESAILFESGFDRLSHPDKVWTVSAPFELRIARAMARDHASKEQILSRFRTQLAQEEKEKRSDFIIHNDTEHSIIEQVKQAILSLSYT